MSVKAFELIPVLERKQILSDKGKSEISCLEVCGKNLYISTNDCAVSHYCVEEKHLPNGKIIFESKKQGHKALGMKRPVLQMKAASALNRIIILCDFNISLLNMLDLEPVVSGARIKGVTSFCLNQNPLKSNPFSVEICVAQKKKNLHIYTVMEDKISLVREITTPEPPITMVMEGSFVCVALQHQYRIYDYHSGGVQDLFPFDTEQLTPIVAQISRDEFLLSATGALGMFASTTGISERPPLQWSSNLLAIACSHPYVLALSDEFITVHSILDQQQKQSVPFQGGHVMGDYDGKVLVTSKSDIYALTPVPIEKQIQALLMDKRVKEALELAQHARKTGLSKDKFKQMFQRIQQQAGFIEFAAGNFAKASEHFHKSKIDVRELLTLYPHLLPAGSFTRSVPPLHEIADVTQLTRADPDRLREYKDFLVTFLQDARSRDNSTAQGEEVNTALLKLYAETNSPELITLIASTASSPSSPTTPSSGSYISLSSVTECAEYLERYGRHHARALLHRCHGDAERALAAWVQLADGKLQDDLFPGLPFVAEYLANLYHHELVWRYAAWLLEKEQKLGVKIFTERPSNEAPSDKMQPEIIVEFLTRYPIALMLYLEYVVFKLKLQKEQYHSHLATLYLDRVLNLKSDPSANQNELLKARHYLQHMLQISSLYQVQMLLARVQNTDLHAEAAILYGKLEDHDKALRILVLKLRDYEAADQYCLLNSEGKDDATRKRLFHTLLSVYLDPNNERRDAMSQPAIRLINNNKDYFDAQKVLAILPDTWSVSLLKEYLTSAIRRSMHTQRTSQIQRSLARGLNINTKYQKTQLSRKMVIIGEDRICPVCHTKFTEPSFAHYPNGVIVHVQCARNKYVCPVTGKMFGTPPPKKADDSAEGDIGKRQTHKMANIPQRQSSPSKRL